MIDGSLKICASAAMLSLCRVLEPDSARSAELSAGDETLASDIEPDGSRRA